MLGRFDVPQTGRVLGFADYEISVLVRAGLLKPLGKPAQNSHKWFAAVEIQELASNRDWLDKATRTVSQYLQKRNEKAQSASKSKETNASERYLKSNGVGKA